METLFFLLRRRLQSPDRRQTVGTRGPQAELFSVLASVWTGKRGIPHSLSTGHLWTRRGTKCTVDLSWACFLLGEMNEVGLPHRCAWGQSCPWGGASPRGAPGTNHMGLVNMHIAAQVCPQLWALHVRQIPRCCCWGKARRAVSPEALGAFWKSVGGFELPQQ